MTLSKARLFGPRLFAVALALLSLSSRSHAQLGLYGKFDFTRDSNLNGKGSVVLKGGGGGIYDDFIHLGPASLGLDLQGSFQTSSQYTFRDVLVGARGSAHLPLVPLRPYAEAFAGAGGPRAKGPYGTGITNVPYSTKLTYGFLGGLDWTILPHLDFRAIELGFAHQKDSAGPTNLLLLSSGLVFRL